MGEKLEIAKDFQNFQDPSVSKFYTLRYTLDNTSLRPLQHIHPNPIKFLPTLQVYKIIRLKNFHLYI